MTKDLVVFNEAEFPQLFDMSFNDRVQLYSEVEAKSFYLRGKILESIKEDKSYKEAGYKTFEKAVKDILDISRSFAYRILDATGVYENLSPICQQNLPINESQLRPLTKLTPEQQIEVWQEVAKDEVPTAKKVSDVVKAKFAIAPAKEKKKKEVVPDIVVVDNTIVDELQVTIVELTEENTALKKKVKELQDICTEFVLGQHKDKDTTTKKVIYSTTNDVTPKVWLITREQAFEFVRLNGNDVQSMAVRSETLPNEDLFKLFTKVREDKLKTTPPSGIPAEILNATGIES